MSEQNIQIVKEAYQHFKTGKIEAVLGLLADNAVWEIPQMNNVPFSGTCHGVQGVGGFFQALAENEDVTLFDMTEFIAQGDQVVALGKYGAQVKSTGRAYALELAHVFTIQSGKIVGFKEYTDTAVTEAAYVKAQNA